MSLTSAKILLDSINPAGNRLTTWELKYPRIVHAELMTHREFSRNTASSRAIPNTKLLNMVLTEAFVPDEWGSNQAGMQAGAPLTGTDAQYATDVWLNARDAMMEYSKKLGELGVHKQLCNRLLEPWQYITVIMSTTGHSNWFNLRHHKDAQPQIKDLAECMWPEWRDSEPRVMPVGGWHLPFITPEDLKDLYQYIWDDLRPKMIADGSYKPDVTGQHLLAKIDLDLQKKVSVGRCARVSYLTHHGVRNFLEDVKLHDKLLQDFSEDAPWHMSPFEHVAQALPTDYRSGNFVGWHQYRKDFSREYLSTFSGPPKA